MSRETRCRSPSPCWRSPSRSTTSSASPLPRKSVRNEYFLEREFEGKNGCLEKKRKLKTWKCKLGNNDTINTLRAKRLKNACFYDNKLKKFYVRWVKNEFQMGCGNKLPYYITLCIPLLNYSFR